MLLFNLLPFFYIFFLQQASSFIFSVRYIHYSQTLILLKSELPFNQLFYISDYVKKTYIVLLAIS
jgi:hypothetical protein